MQVRCLSSFDFLFYPSWFSLPSILGFPNFHLQSRPRAILSNGLLSDCFVPPLGCLPSSFNSAYPKQNPYPSFPSPLQTCSPSSVPVSVNSILGHKSGVILQFPFPLPWINHEALFICLLKPSLFCHFVPSSSPLLPTTAISHQNCCTRPCLPFLPIIIFQSILLSQKWQ